jgi:hypothetical protein
MMKNKKLSLNNIFRGSVGKSNINDDIYDRWHNTKVNEAFVEEEAIGSQTELPKNTDEGYYYWIGKDYANSYREDFKDVHEYAKGTVLTNKSRKIKIQGLEIFLFYLDQFDRAEVPRMPWRDQGCVLFGHSARDLARHFIQRWNQCKVSFKKSSNNLLLNSVIFFLIQERASSVP